MVIVFLVDFLRSDSDVVQIIFSVQINMKRKIVDVITFF